VANIRQKEKHINMRFLQMSTAHIEICDADLLVLTGKGFPYYFAFYLESVIASARRARNL
jgi:hypothetical protein